MKRLLEKLLNLTEEDIFKPYSVEEIIQQKLKNCTLNSDGTYSCKGSVNLKGLGLTSLPVKFKEVKENFYCDHNKLTSLEGSPIKVGRNFWCHHNQLTSLKGSPEVVGRGFWCDHNQLTTLEGSPKEVGGDYYCNNNLVPIGELKKTVSRSYFK